MDIITIVKLGEVELSLVHYHVRLSVVLNCYVKSDMMVYWMFRLETDHLFILFPSIFSKIFEELKIFQ